MVDQSAYFSQPPLVSTPSLNHDGNDYPTSLMMQIKASDGHYEDNVCRADSVLNVWKDYTR